MSDYTITVKQICESISGVKDNPNTAITNSIPTIFDFEFSVYTVDDPNRKNKLERLILKRYYLREIAHPTTGVWKWELENRLNQIMPFYNEMYKTAKELADTRPTHEYEHTRTDTSTLDSDTTNTGTSSTTDKTTNVGTFSDLPQGQLTDFENNSYLTNASKNTGNSTTANTTNGTSATDSTTTATSTGHGHNTNMATLVKQYREQIANIDDMVIRDLAVLFMGVYEYEH